LPGGGCEQSKYCLASYANHVSCDTAFELDGKVHSLHKAKNNLNKNKIRMTDESRLPVEEFKSGESANCERIFNPI
jgi:hypothetical protein